MKERVLSGVEAPKFTLRKLLWGNKKFYSNAEGL